MDEEQAINRLLDRMTHLARRMVSRYDCMDAEGRATQEQLPSKSSHTHNADISLPKLLRVALWLIHLTALRHLCIKMSALRRE